MKQITAGQLAFSYAGAFLGAGFVSGQELWQFFACFGPVGLLGFCLTAVLFFIVNYSLLRLVHATGQVEMGRLMTLGERPLLAGTVNYLQILLLFGVSVIMIAGISSLAEQLLDVPSWIAGAVFTLAVILISLMGMQGMVTVFSFVVPTTTICAVILGAVTLIQCNGQFALPTGSVSSMIPHWTIGFPTYAAYNLFGTVGIMVSFAPVIQNERTLRRGFVLGSGILILLAGSIIAALAAYPAAGAAELPMAILAGRLHPALEAGYGILMAMGMFSSTLAIITAAVNQITVHLKKTNINTKHLTIILLIAAFLLSQVGFGSLIGVIYPVFGYLSIPFLCFIVINWFKIHKKYQKAS